MEQQELLEEQPEKNDFLDIKEQNFSFLGVGARLIGEFHLNGVVRISAQMEGKLFVESSGKLIIERNGSFNGKIQSDDIEIFGLVDGEINSNGRVILRPCSAVNGKINCKDLVIYPGATLNIDGHTI
ncbi:MAG: polymer-forming cytoskeletal protein [Oligoflexia bacterium]|nr:polymer-forming cytoskeletal protein [Oligoflexia bacterium]